jgi:hypothetical protein
MNRDTTRFSYTRLINRSWHRLSYYIRGWNEKKTVSVADMPPFYLMAEKVDTWLRLNSEEAMFRYGVEHNHFLAFVADESDVPLLQLLEPALTYDGYGDWSCQQRGRGLPSILIARHAALR